MGEKYLHVIGTRPNAVKAAPVLREMHELGYNQALLHTGQHFDFNLSRLIERDLGIPIEPIRFDLKGRSAEMQLGEVASNVSSFIKENAFTQVIVYGDVTSTLAASIAAKYSNRVLIHVEAGLRSGDLSMPEEINRIMSDSISDVLFTTTAEAEQNLLREGKAQDSIHFVGNTMIDSLLKVVGNIEKEPSRSEFFGLVTIHRQSNVDDPSRLKRIVEEVRTISESVELLWPLHPRTEGALRKSGLYELLEKPNIQLLPPMGYKEFIESMFRCKFLVSDSGGVQEEAAVLGVPTFILRESTERAVALNSGTVRLVNLEDLTELVSSVDPSRVPVEIPYWDGKSASRIVQHLEK